MLEARSNELEEWRAAEKPRLNAFIASHLLESARPTESSADSSDDPSPKTVQPAEPLTPSSIEF